MVVPFITVTTSVEISVTVLKVMLVGESVRVDVVVGGAVRSAGTLKIPAQHVYIELILPQSFDTVAYYNEKKRNIQHSTRSFQLKTTEDKDLDLVLK
jgi:hypothetical protein